MSYCAPDKPIGSVLIQTGRRGLAFPGDKTVLNRECVAHLLLWAIEPIWPVNELRKWGNA